jgi:hypothetical protein
MMHRCNSRFVVNAAVKSCTIRTKTVHTHTHTHTHTELRKSNGFKQAHVIFSTKYCTKLLRGKIYYYYCYCYYYYYYYGNANY